MTVKELKEILSSMDENLEIVLEVVDAGVERNEIVDHVEYNDTEFYIVGESEVTE